MLAVIYFFAPMVVRFKDSISDNAFCIVSFIILVWSCISYHTSTRMLIWDLGYDVEFLGYFALGYVLRKRMPKSNFWGTSCIIIGVFLELIVVRLRYWSNIVMHNQEGFIYEDPFSPLVVVASILIFAGFTMLQINRGRVGSSLANLSFIIFLFHAGVYDLIKRVVRSAGGDAILPRMNPLYSIPLFVLMVLILSYGCSQIYNRLCSMINYVVVEQIRKIL